MTVQDIDHRFTYVVGPEELHIFNVGGGGSYYLNHIMILNQLSYILR